MNSQRTFSKTKHTQKKHADIWWDILKSQIKTGVIFDLSVGDIISFPEYKLNENPYLKKMY